MLLLFALGQWEFMSAFWALSHPALHGRAAARTGKGSAVCYVKGETAFGAIQQILRFHDSSFSISQPLNGVFKVFLEMFKHFDAKLLSNKRSNSRRVMKSRI
jgi:folate-dependent tRNA-U54 methylase TrmFO/GidA